MLEKIKALFIKYKEIISYLFFGVVSTVVNWIVYAIAVRAFSIDLSAVKNTGTGNVFMSLLSGDSGREIRLLFFANLIAWFAAVVVAYITNKLWVFESKSWKPTLVLKELWEFVAARIATGAMEWFGIPALVMAGMNQRFLGVEGFWAKAVVSVAVIVLNYVFSKFIIFKKKKSD